jgi:peptide/nickel transport system substrate-binding protein
MRDRSPHEVDRDADRLTVRIVLAQPNAGLLHKVSAFNQGWLVSRKAVTEFGEKYALNPIGTGPFVFDRWTAGSDVRLVANKAYFEGAPKLSEVIFRVIKDETAAAIALENREIDIFYQLNSRMSSRAAKRQRHNALNRSANNTSNLVLNKHHQAARRRASPARDGACDEPQGTHRRFLQGDQRRRRSPC